MKKYFLIPVYMLFLLFKLTPTWAEVEIKMDTTTIKGNTELPKIIYIIPWQEPKKNKTTEHRLVIHSLYGNLFDPVLPHE